MEFERVVAQTIFNFDDPQEGSIVQDAVRFVKLTDGKVTPWADIVLDEPANTLRFKYRGQDYNLFSKAVEVIRLVYSPREDKIPEIFTAI